MYRFMIPLMVVFSAILYSSDGQTFHPPRIHSAASDAQIRFALENKYDDTGPGAKQPEYAYNTYKTLDEAIVAYLDDPDTKLPEHEREKAIQRLIQPANIYPKPLPRYFPKTVEEYTGYKPPTEGTPALKYGLPEKKVVYQEPSVVSGFDFREFGGNDIFVHRDKILEPYKLHRIQSVKGSPLNLAHYSRDPDLQAAHDQFDPHPKYTYTYGVHDKDTGDLKTAHETRTGGTVHGFYSFKDADGKQRTVQYTADDHQGFRATVDRAHA